METLIEALEIGPPAAKPIISCREDALKLMEVWNSCDLFGSSRFCAPGFGQDDNPKLFSLPRAADLVQYISSTCEYVDGYFQPQYALIETLCEYLCIRDASKNALQLICLPDRDIKRGEKFQAHNYLLFHFDRKSGLISSLLMAPVSRTRTTSLKVDGPQAVYCAMKSIGSGEVEILAEKHAFTAAY